MCGRFALAVPSKKKIAETFGLPDSPEIPARYNIAPGQDIAAVAGAAPHLSLNFFRWGLTAPWSGPGNKGSSLINARAESVCDKPAFCSAFRSGRCLIPATGFYEWKKNGKESIPYFISLRNRNLFAFAGICKADRDEGTCAIITTEPNDLVRKIHHRMPEIIAPDEYITWLKTGPGTDEPAHRLLGPWPAEEMEAVRVSRAVNSVQNDTPDLIKPEVSEENIADKQLTFDDIESTNHG